MANDWEGWGAVFEWEPEWEVCSVETLQLQNFSFDAPGLASILYSHTVDYIKEVSNKNLNSTATTYEKTRFQKQMDEKFAKMRKNLLGFLAKTDAECILGAGQDNKPSLGSQKVLELVESYLYVTPEGFEAIGKELMVR